MLSKCPFLTIKRVTSVALFCKAKLTQTGVPEMIRMDVCDRCGSLIFPLVSSAVSAFSLAASLRVAVAGWTLGYPGSLSFFASGWIAVRPLDQADACGVSLLVSAIN